MLVAARDDERRDDEEMGEVLPDRAAARLEINREFTVQEHSVLSWLQGEGFYDTRYDGLNRMLYQPGVEITFDRRFRLELYVARQDDRRPTKESLNALGLVAKWYD